ncbi:3'-5' exonuclease [Bradyrhizobium sp. RDT46]|uniref:3'-5' exonuclease n=1 Tax=Bradyrhizobium sp. RDT46 TaxID=3341829 RepID=UPI0035C77FD8
MSGFGRSATGHLERLALSLESCGDYRLLRRLKPRLFAPASDGPPTRRAVFLDVETTGLDPEVDTVVELAMLPFDYDPEGRIVGVGKPFAAFRDPGRAIAQEVVALTGITNEAVAGATVDEEAVRQVLEGVSLVVAHNAGFDRPFCEPLWPLFARKAWACSLKEIDWAGEGFEGTRLSHIAASYGFFFDAHRAVEDCHAGVEILARELPRSRRTVLAALPRVGPRAEAARPRGESTLRCAQRSQIARIPLDVERKGRTARLVRGSRRGSAGS